MSLRIIPLSLLALLLLVTQHGAYRYVLLQLKSETADRYFPDQQQGFEKSQSENEDNGADGKSFYDLDSFLASVFSAPHFPAQRQIKLLPPSSLPFRLVVSHYLSRAPPLF